MSNEAKETSAQACTRILHQLAALATMRVFTYDSVYVTGLVDCESKEATCAHRAVHGFMSAALSGGS